LTRKLESKEDLSTTTTAIVVVKEAICSAVIGVLVLFTSPVGTFIKTLSKNEINMGRNGVLQFLKLVKLSNLDSNKLPAIVVQSPQKLNFSPHAPTRIDSLC